MAHPYLTRFSLVPSFCSPLLISLVRYLKRPCCLMCRAFDRPELAVSSTFVPCRRLYATARRRSQCVSNFPFIHTVLRFTCIWFACFVASPSPLWRTKSKQLSRWFFRRRTLRITLFLVDIRGYCCCSSTQNVLLLRPEKQWPRTESVH